MTDALYLIVTIAGQRVAMAAAPVGSVVEIDAITPVPRVSPHIAGVSALRSRVLTIVDCLASLGLGAGPREGLLRTVIVTVDGHQYGLLVEDVTDVVALPGGPRPVSLTLGSGWARAATGMIEHDGDALLLIDPAALVAGPIALAA